MTARQCVGIKIKEARAGMGLTQDEFGELVGLAASSLSLYEKGKRSPDFDRLEKISTVTNRPMGWFFECATMVPSGATPATNPNTVAKKTRKPVSPKNGKTQHPANPYAVGLPPTWMCAA